MDLSLEKVLSSINIMYGFRATRIWLLNLDKIKAKMGPLKSYYSIPSKKLIVEGIMDEDIPSAENNAKHYYVEDDDDVEQKKVLFLKMHPS